MKPLISVVTVCFNAVKDIEKTILSVINQTYENIEYIIIDGGSTDGTVDVIKKYADHITYWVSEPDKGIYDAMNKGIKIATGEWINFMNAGDRFYTYNTIEIMTCQFFDTSCCYYGDAWIDSINKRYWGIFTKRKLAIGNICHQSIFYSAKILKQEQFDISYPIFADYVWNIIHYKNILFTYVPYIVCYYEFGGVSTTNKAHDTRFLDNKRRLIVNTCGLVNYYIGVIYRFLIKMKLNVITLL